MNEPRRAIPRLAVLILLWASVAVAQSAQPAQTAGVPFTRSEAMIKMRDGIQLHTVILAPQTQTESLPILIDRASQRIYRSSRYPSRVSVSVAVNKN